MKGAQLAIIATVLLYVCAGCQESAAVSFNLAGAIPDFIVVAIVALGLGSTARNGLAIGFVGGALTGAVLGVNMWQYVLSRMIIGYIAGWIADQKFQNNPAVCAVAALVGTVIGQIVLMFLAPPPSIVPYLTATIASAVYNGVIAVPLSLGLTRLVGSLGR